MVFLFTALEWGPLALSQGQCQAGAGAVQEAPTLLHVGLSQSPTPRTFQGSPSASLRCEFRVACSRQRVI